MIGSASGAASSAPVVVVGANGLVGSRLAARLSREHRVVAVGRGPAREAIGQLLAADRRGEEKLAARAITAVGKPEHGAERGLRSGVEYEEIDLALDGALQDLIETRCPSAVIFAAGMTDVDACEREVPMAWQLNVRSVEEAALGCRETGARLISLSTDYVFDGNAKSPYGEEDLPAPRGVYARTKRAGEEAALLLAPDVAVCRVAVIFSGLRFAKRTFAVGAAEALRAGKEVKAFSDQFVSPTLADSAAELCITVMNSDAQGIVHCCGGEVVSRVEFARALARKLGADETLVVPVELGQMKLPAPRPHYSGLKTDRIRALGGHPLSLDESLDRFLLEQADG